MSGSYPMSTTLVKVWPCEHCESAYMRYDGDAPYLRCRRSKTGDLDCERMDALRAASDLIVECASVIARQPDLRLRALLAYYAIDFSQQLLDYFRATLDDDGFLHAACVQDACLHCTIREPDDGATAACRYCDPETLSLV